LANSAPTTTTPMTILSRLETTCPKARPRNPEKPRFTLRERYRVALIDLAKKL
jgi:hypothetical protein